MTDASIIDAVRSPTDKRVGSLKDVHDADLDADVIRALVERHTIPDDEYADFISRAVEQPGSLAGDVARTCWPAAGYSEAVPGVTIDRQSGFDHG